MGAIFIKRYFAWAVRIHFCVNGLWAARFTKSLIWRNIGALPSTACSILLIATASL